MKPTPEMKATFDRTSTREELYKVIELLHAMRPIQDQACYAGHSSQFDLTSDDREPQTDALTTDAELVSIAELGLLDDPLDGSTELLN